MEQLTSIGILTIFVGFILVLAGAFLSALKSPKETDSKTKFAIAGFIGPIPFGFGNDRNMVWLVVVLSLVLLLFWLFVSVRTLK